MLINLFQRFLSTSRIISKPDYEVIIVSRYPRPDELQQGSLFIVQSGNITKWLCLRCPDKCGEIIQLSLNPKQRPSWSIETDWLSRPTIWPSINRLNGCKSHFWIKKGKVIWHRD